MVKRYSFIDSHSKIAMNYRNFLINEGRSYKTNHNYLSAINQFFKWCTVMEYIPSNPFTKIKLGQKPSKKKHEEQLGLLSTHLQSWYQITKYSEFKKADLWVMRWTLPKMASMRQTGYNSHSVKGNVHHEN